MIFTHSFSIFYSTSVFFIQSYEIVHLVPFLELLLLNHSIHKIREAIMNKKPQWTIKKWSSPGKQHSVQEIQYIHIQHLRHIPCLFSKSLTPCLPIVTTILTVNILGYSACFLILKKQYQKACIFFVCFLSFNIIFVRVIQVISTMYLWFGPSLCFSVYHRKYTPQLIHSSLDPHLSYFHFRIFQITML